MKRATACGWRCAHNSNVMQVWPICGDGLDLEIRHTIQGMRMMKWKHVPCVRHCHLKEQGRLASRELLTVMLPAGTGESRQLLWRAVNPNAAHDRPQRQKVEFRVALHTGDTIDFTVHPRGSMDCDGVYIVDMQIWRNEGGLRTHEARRLRRTS